MCQQSRLVPTTPHGFVGGFVKILVGAAYPVIREGLRALLSTQGEPVVGVAGTPREILDAALAQQPTVAVLDRDLEEGTPVDAVRLLAAEVPDVAVLLLTEPGAEADTLEALQAGARGCVWRGATGEELGAAARALAAGEVVLSLGGPGQNSVFSERYAMAQVRQEITPREMEVLRLLAQGLSNKAIAQGLGITESTVKYHIAALLAKLGASTRTEAVAVAYRRGLLAL